MGVAARSDRPEFRKRTGPQLDRKEAGLCPVGGSAAFATAPRCFGPTYSMSGADSELFR